MAEIKSAKYTTPDGEERDLRFSQASQFRCASEKERLEKIGGQLPDYFILWAMLFDEDDNPPKFKDGHPRAGQEMTAGWIGANTDPLAAFALRAAIAEATTGGRVEKKTLDKMQQLAKDQVQLLAGKLTGHSDELTLALEEHLQAVENSSASSGGSPPENLTPSAPVTITESETPTFAPV